MSLKFSPANSKTERLAKTSLKKWLTNKRKIYSFNLPSGVTCPAAHLCRAHVAIINGRKKVIHGDKQEFTCYSTSLEALYPSLYNLCHHNFNILRKIKKCPLIAEKILSELPIDLGICRIHSNGDFYNQEYFNAWMIVASQRPHILFYAYTKSLNYWIKYIEEYGPIGKNVSLVASRGGTLDHLIDKYNLREARVIFDKKDKGDWPIDFNDFLAASPDKRNQSFNLLLHGGQKSNTPASVAWQKIKKAGGGYSRK
jgi:hypothetical protein